MPDWAGAYGAGGAVDALRQIVADKILKQKIEEDNRRARVQEAENVARRTLQADQFRAEQAQRVAEVAGQRDERYQDRLLNVRKQDLETQERQTEREADRKRYLDESFRRGEERKADIAQRNLEREDTQKHQTELQARTEGLQRDLANLRAKGDSGAMNDREKLNATIALGKTYNFNTKAQREIQRYHGLMVDALKSLKAGGDHTTAEQAIVNSFNKILDPNSVVREGEYDRTSAGQSIMRQMEALAQRFPVGGRITPGALADMEKLSRVYAEGAAAFNAREQKRISRQATAFGLDPTLIFTEDEDDQPSGAPGPGGGGAPTVTQELDYVPGKGFVPRGK